MIRSETTITSERIEAAYQMAHDTGVIYGKWRARYSERAAQFGKNHRYTLAVKKVLFAAASDKAFAIENAYRVERAYKLNQ